MKVIVRVEKNYARALEREVKSEFPDYDLGITAQEDITDILSSTRNELDFSTIAIIVGSVVATEAGKTFAKKATEDIYEFIKRKLAQREIQSVDIDKDG